MIEEKSKWKVLVYGVKVVNGDVVLFLNGEDVIFLVELEWFIELILKKE